MDEQWGYVGAKSRQRWLFYAYDSLRKTVVAHVFGERTMATLGRLMSLLSPFDVVIWMTDGWPLYESRRDYLFAVKGNQGRLNKAFEEKFPLKELNNPEHDSYAMSEKSHGREEIRLHIVCDVPDELIDFTFEWKGLKKLCAAFPLLILQSSSFITTSRRQCSLFSTCQWFRIAVANFSAVKSAELI